MGLVEKRKGRSSKDPRNLQKARGEKKNLDLFIGTCVYKFILTATVNMKMEEAGTSGNKSRAELFPIFSPPLYPWVGDEFETRFFQRWG